MQMPVTHLEPLKQSEFRMHEEELAQLVNASPPRAASNIVRMRLEFDTDPPVENTPDNDVVAGDIGPYGKDSQTRL